MTLKDDPNLLTLRIGSHVFKVRCPADKHDKMKIAEAAVAREYERVRKREKVADGERAALMVALKMASESSAIQPEPAIEALIGECLELASRAPED